MKILIHITVFVLFVLSGLVFADDSSLRYNPMENRWSYESTKDDLKYNPMENKWSYENQDSSLRYNPMENKWEYAE